MPPVKPVAAFVYLIVGGEIGKIKAYEHLQNEKDDRHNRECHLIKYFMLSNICLKKFRSCRIITATDWFGCNETFGFSVNRLHSRDKLCSFRGL